MVMNMLLTGLSAMTGDNGKPLLVAICLIVSIVLMVVLVVIGKNSPHTEDEEDNGSEDGRES